MILTLCTFFACTKTETKYITKEIPGGNASIPPEDAILPDVSHFPGEVGQEVNHVKNYQVTLDLNYRDIGNNLKIEQAPQPQFSVGLYAAPDDTIKIRVPKDITGLSVQIGAWTDTVVSNLPNTVISSRMKLKEGNNIILSPYGGTVYILANTPIKDSVTLAFSGAVKAPDFVLGSTSPFTWRDQLQETQVPWVELRSKNIILTVPRKQVLEAGNFNPGYLLQTMDNLLQKDIYEWSGLKKNERPSLPQRVVIDNRLTRAHAGYPIVFPNTTPLLKKIFNKRNNILPDAWNVIHKIGINFQQTPVWVWKNLPATTSNIFIVKAAHDAKIELDNLHPEIKIQFPKALAYADATGEKDFDNDIANPIFKLLPFVQILEKAGYDFIPFLSKKARALDNIPQTTLEKHDFFYKTLCEFTKKDWKLFFRAWGIHLSKDAVESVFNKGTPLMTTEVWTYDPLTDTGGSNQYNPYDNRNWSVINFSSQISENNASGSGFALNAIDGDKNTYWHSNWFNGEVQPPHFIVVDMKVPLEVSSFYFFQRQSGNNKTRIKNLNIKIANDTTNWTDLGSFSLEDNEDKQVVNLSENHTFRYFKVTVPNKEDIYGSDYAALAEVGVIKGN